MSLYELVRDAASIDTIAAYLDGLAHAERLAETRTLGRGEQRRLYQAAERAAPLDLGHFVPPGIAARVPVRHHGRNTLPLPGPLRLFEKRFAIPMGNPVGVPQTPPGVPMGNPVGVSQTPPGVPMGNPVGVPQTPPGAPVARLFGYNQSPFLGTIGPGFFVAVPTAGTAAWEARGAVVVDYFQVPDGPVPEGWPAVIPNTKGLQRFVYHRTRDFMRRVSAHVSVGAAYKVETALDHYFMLCREDEAAPVER